MESPWTIGQASHPSPLRRKPLDRHHLCCPTPLYDCCTGQRPPPRPAPRILRSACRAPLPILACLLWWLLIWLDPRWGWLRCHRSSEWPPFLPFGIPWCRQQQRCWVGCTHARRKPLCGSASTPSIPIPTLSSSLSTTSMPLTLPLVVGRPSRILMKKIQ